MSLELPFPRLAPSGSTNILNYLHIDFALLCLTLILVLAGSAKGVGTILGPFPRVLSGSSPAGDTRAAVTVPRAAGSVSPALVNTLELVAQRYRIAPEALQPIFVTIQRVARERKLDPLLIIAVISVESRFNPYSQSPMGAQGLMQVIPRFHQDKLPKDKPDASLLDPVHNITVGAQILQEAIRRQGGLMEGLQYYAGAVDDPEQSYANKVISEKQRLEQPARRRDSNAG